MRMPDKNKLYRDTIELQVIPSIPPSIDLADTVSLRLGLILTDQGGTLPDTSEIDSGTITIDRKAQGGTSWTNIVNDAPCSEQAGFVYYDEVFDGARGYSTFDVIRITFKNIKVTDNGIDYEFVGDNGITFYSRIEAGDGGGGGDATLANQQAIIERLSGDVEEGQTSALNLYSDTATSGETGADVLTISANKQTKVHALILYVGNCHNRARLDIRLYTNVNGTERRVYYERFNRRTELNPDVVWIVIGTMAIASDIRLEVQSQRSEDTAVVLEYQYITEQMDF